MNPQTTSKYWPYYPRSSPRHKAPTSDCSSIVRSVHGPEKLSSRIFIDLADHTADHWSPGLLKFKIFCTFSLPLWYITLTWHLLRRAGILKSFVSNKARKHTLFTDSEPWNHCSTSTLPPILSLCKPDRSVVSVTECTCPCVRQIYAIIIFLSILLHDLYTDRTTCAADSFVIRRSFRHMVVGECVSVRSSVCTWRYPIFTHGGKCVSQSSNSQYFVNSFL